MAKDNGAVKEKKQPTIADILEKYNLKNVQEYEEVKRLPTGSLELDKSIGGGWGVGCINEVWGAPSFGKSLLTMITIGRTLFAGKKAVLFDLEKSFDEKWARHFMDVNSENFILVQQHNDTYGEGILNSILALADMGVAFIALDSKDAIVFEAELEGGVGPTNMGKRSFLLGNFVRRLSQIVGDSETAFLFTSQVRANFGNTYQPLTTSGGHALDHFCSIQVSLNQPAALKVSVDKKEVVVGTSINTHSGKNKTFKAKQNASVAVRKFDTEGGEIWAVDTASEVFKIGTELGMFTLADGKPYDGAGNAHYGGELLGSKNVAISRLRAEPTMCFQIEQAIRSKLGWA